MRQAGTASDATYYLVQYQNGVAQAHIPFTDGPPPFDAPDALGLVRDGQEVGYIIWQPGAVPV
jgi:hypothetical protein